MKSSLTKSLIISHCKNVMESFHRQHQTFVRQKIYGGKIKTILAFAQRSSAHRDNIKKI